MLGGQKKCEKCGKAAMYKFTKFVNGKAQDRFFCEDHASEASSYVQKSGESQDPLKSILKGMFENIGEGAAAAAREYPDVSCSSCGLPFEAYKRTLLLGCPECYRSFAELMIAELRKFHGDTHHVGRRPPESTSGQDPAGSPNQADLFEEFQFNEDEAAAPVEEPSDMQEEMQEEDMQKVDVEDMRRQLKEAVAREDFAEAARLRDQIRTLQGS